MSKYEFDTDTSVEEVSGGMYRGYVHERWNISSIANGGYVMAIGMRALGLALERPDPVTVTAHFLRPSTPGPLLIQTESIKRGRRFSTGSVRLIQADREVVRMLATYGELGTDAGFSRVSAVPPAVPLPGDGRDSRSRLDAPPIAQRYDLRFAPETVRWLDGQRSDLAEIRAAIRFRDRRPPDVMSLAAFADAFPPPSFAWMDPTWLPTLELTLHVRARPVGEWLRGHFRTRFLFGGLLEEDGELWDEAGRLVAQSRQLAMVFG
jgi:acyl-CoA thioesterase